MSAKDLTTASSSQPWRGVVWLKLSLNASKTLQITERVYLQSFICITTCNRKLFQKLPNVSRRFDYSITFTATMWGCGIEQLRLSFNASRTLQSIKRMYLQSFKGIGTTNQKLFKKMPNVSQIFEWFKWWLIASKTLQSIKRVYLQSFRGIGTSNPKFLLKLPHVSQSFDHSFTFTAKM